MSKWERVPLYDICEGKIKTISSKDDIKIDYIDISSIDNVEKKVISYQTINSKEAPSRAKQILKMNDILVSTVRPNLNSVAINCIESKNIMVGSTGYCVLRCKHDANVDYVFNFCKSTAFIERLVSVAKGASYPAVSNSDVKNSLIPLPPLEIQKEVAKILNTVDEILSMRKQQFVELDNLIKSTFHDMFGDPVTNPLGWEVRKLSNVTSKIGSGATPKGGKESYKAEGISLIRSMNVHNGLFKYEQLAHLDKEQAQQLDNVIVEENDVLINITGASVARSCIVPKDVLPARVNQHVSIVRLKQEIATSEFINNLFTNKCFQDQLLAIGGAGGATREAITKQQLEQLIIPLPPISLQTKFSEIVNKINEQKVLVKKAIGETQNLFDSLMNEYFD